MALSVLSASCSTIHQIGESKDTLWKLRGDHNTIYLLGSIHVLSQKCYPLKAALNRAFEDSSRIVFEIDLNRFTTTRLRREFRRTAFYPTGQSLSKKVSPETVELLKLVLPVYGLTLKKVERLKPWFLAEWLSSRTLEMAGFSETLGVDVYFFRKARSTGKPVLGLETIRDQAEIFDHFSDEENERYLIGTLATLATYPASIGRLVTAWQNGDVRLLDQILNQDQHADPVTHKALFSDRNTKWLPQIEAIAHKNENYLVIVGAGHLVGDDGVVAQLRRNGYTVVQM
ncbi:MAG TPA: TraB/GumN family protein [Chthoniobacterales bacterium]|nr:TraB/GumN family protein [Chthoniobacterales bacterium]